MRYIRCYVCSSINSSFAYCYDKYCKGKCKRIRCGRWKKKKITKEIEIRAVEMEWAMIKTIIEKVWSYSEGMIFWRTQISRLRWDKSLLSISLISTHLLNVSFMKIGFRVKRYTKISISDFVKSKELILNNHYTGHGMK